MRKVPEVVALFWVIKVLTTAFGESMSDYLVNAINPAIAVVIGAIILVIALVLQFRAKRYIPGIYWFTVAMVAVFGTMAADVLHIGLGIPYLDATIFFLIVLAVIFALWWMVEKSLSIHSITTRRRELFYWATVMATFALGTAAGDMTAATFGWGYLVSGIVFAVLIAFVAGAHYAVKSMLAHEHHHQSTNAVLAFWLAYILTRPLGASFADWMGKSHALGGLGWGDGAVSVGLAILIVCFVFYSSRMRVDTKQA